MADDLAALAGRIRSAFPSLAFDRAVLNDEGDDHRVIVLDDAWIVRFVRDPARRPLFAAERAVLRRLGDASPVPVPRYEFVSADQDFGGYRRLPGEPLRPRLFAALSQDARDRIVDETARFLRLLHGLAPAALAEGGGEAAFEWSGADWRERWLRERRALVAPVMGAALLTDADRFYDAFAAAPPPPRAVLIHGDVTDDHLLLAPQRDRLSGVIDFGDVCIGDPAYDLAFFFAYGDHVIARLAKRYDPQGRDPPLLDRARRQYARFRIEQLRPECGLGPTEREAVIAELPALLAEAVL